MAAGGGLLTAADLKGYEVIEREPLEVQWRATSLTNPPPAFGGDRWPGPLESWRTRPGWPPRGVDPAHARGPGRVDDRDHEVRCGTGPRGVAAVRTGAPPT